MTDANPKGSKSAGTDRGPSRTIVGTVVSDAMQKTIVVAEQRLVTHARYGKVLKRAVRYKAHDEKEQAKKGDEVEIAASRRLSKSKHWRLVRIVRRGRVEAVRGDEDREKVATRPITRPTPPQAPAAGEVTS
jgi:small subunit ribosomal protein S17